MSLIGRILGTRPAEPRRDVEIRLDHDRILACLSRLLAPDNYGGAVAPHCDMKVLHAPGECEYCDHYPHYQALRDLWQINFTGHHDADKAVCPSEQARPLEVIESWPGNIAHRSA